MCVFVRGPSVCSNKALDVYKDSGVGEGFCLQHTEEVRHRMYNREWRAERQSQVGSGKNDKYVEDYIKLFALMLDKRRCREVVEQLNIEVYNNEQINLQQFKLSETLALYESFCWFPMVHRLYVGALTSKNYQSSIALGYMPKDSGAGSQHGEFSHRIQWHIVMRVVTGGFKEPKMQVFHHTPLDLFTFLGSDWAMMNGLWGFIFDDGLGVAYNNPAVLNMELCGNFHYRKHKDEAAEWRKKEWNNLILFGAKKRADKRLRVFERAKEIWMLDYKKSTVLLEINLDQGVIGLLQRWKKMGKPKIEATKVTGNKQADQMLIEIASKIWKEQKFEEKTGKYDKDLDETNALLLKGERLISSIEVKYMVNSSYEGFRPYYQYVTQNGIKKLF